MISYICITYTLYIQYVAAHLAHVAPTKVEYNLLLLAPGLCWLSIALWSHVDLPLKDAAAGRRIRMLLETSLWTLARNSWLGAISDLFWMNRMVCSWYFQLFSCVSLQE